MLGLFSGQYFLGISFFNTFNKYFNTISKSNVLKYFLKFTLFHSKFNPKLSVKFKKKLYTHIITGISECRRLKGRANLKKK